MRQLLLLVLLLLQIASLSFAQEDKNIFGKFDFLIGNWKGEGRGKPGEGEGYFSFQLDLNSKVLLRKSHSEYPAVKDKPQIIHDDLMIIYPDSSGKPGKAIYFDNEGHVINYAITFPDEKNIVFTSDKASDSPIFRLNYTKINEDIINVKFEMSRDGIDYFTYIEGKSRRIKLIKRN